MEINLRVPIQFHPAQQAVHDDPARFKCMCIGRRGGKTAYGEGEGTLTVADGGKVGYFIPKFSLAEEVWRDYKRIFGEAIQAKVARTNEQQRRLDFGNGGVLEIWSMATEDAGLGRAYDLAIIDEAATGDFMTMWNQNILPTLTDREGKALFLSTPRGFNWFYDIWRRGQDPDWGNWKSWRFPSNVNPFLKPSVIAEAKRSMPERLFAQEYLAEFLSDATAVFRNVHNCRKATLHDRAIPGHAYVIGGDIARINDFSVFMVIDVTASPKQVVHIDVSNGVAFEQQMDRLAFLCHRFSPMVCMIEDNGNLQMIETLILRGLPIVAFHTSYVTKPFAVDKLALAFEQESLWIPDDEVLVGQLQAYQPTRLPSGTIKYGAPEGMHDDYVSALMIANWAAAEQTIGEAGYYRFG